MSDLVTLVGDSMRHNEAMIDLSRTRDILVECLQIVDELHGLALDESDAIEGKGRAEIRQERARMSQDIQLLATRLELAAAAARIEYWYARGERDPLSPDRVG